MNALHICPLLLQVLELGGRALVRHDGMMITFFSFAFGEEWGVCDSDFEELG